MTSSLTLMSYQHPVLQLQVSWRGVRWMTSYLILVSHHAVPCPAATSLLQVHNLKGVCHVLLLSCMWNVLVWHTGCVWNISKGLHGRINMSRGDPGGFGHKVHLDTAHPIFWPQKHMVRHQNHDSTLIISRDITKIRLFFYDTFWDRWWKNNFCCN